MTASVLAHCGRSARGLTQTELSSRSGVAGSSLSLIEHGKREPTVATLEAILRATRHTVVTIPTVRSDAACIAAEIAIAIRHHDEETAFKRFIQLADNLAAEKGATRVGLTLTEPAPTGSLEWDVAIAALSEYRLNAGRLPVPDWIRLRKGLVGRKKWAPRTSDYEIEVEVAQVPKEFRRRGILIEARTLESV